MPPCAPPDDSPGATFSITARRVPPRVDPFPTLPGRRSVRNALQFLVEALDASRKVRRRQIDCYRQAPQDTDRGLFASRLDQGDIRTVDARCAGDIFLSQSELISALLERRTERLQEDGIGAGSHARHYHHKVNCRHVSLDNIDSTAILSLPFEACMQIHPAHQSLTSP